MKNSFKVQVTRFDIIRALPDAWANEDYLQLLDVMEYGNVAEIDPAELKDMCMMAITDFEPDEAAKILLEYVLKDKLNKGQIENLSHEMIDEKMWEEYADLETHEKFFNVHQLLYDSFEGTFPRPEAVQINLAINAKKVDHLTLFSTDVEVKLLQVLVQGMSENTLINRLFDDSLASGEFKEAEHIIWQINKKEITGTEITFEVISSPYWMHDLKGVGEFDAELIEE